MTAQVVARPWRRYLRISLRGLIVLVLVLGGALGWMVHRAEVQRDAVAAIERFGNVQYHWEWKDGLLIMSRKPRPPKWLIERIGLDYFGTVVAAHLTQVSDQRMVPVGNLKHLDTLSLTNSSITGVGLAHLEGLTDLRTLFIFSSQVSDDGLGHLRKLPRLGILSFSGTKIGDAGLGNWPV